MNKFHKTIITAASVATVFASTAGVSFAQGGNGGSGGGSVTATSNIPTTSGPCANVVTPEGNFFVAQLTNERFPGSVAVTIGITSANVPYAKNVCADKGWTVQSKSVTNGIQMELSYNGQKAVDFKYVAGKTVIRSY